MCVFFFKQNTAYEMRISDWSSDVCSSDLRSPLSQFRVRWTRIANNFAVKRGADMNQAVSAPAARLGVDIGGTFTDAALEVGEKRYTAKALTPDRKSGV